MPLWLLITWPIFVAVVFVILPISLEYYFEHKENKKCKSRNKYKK